MGIQRRALLMRGVSFAIGGAFVSAMPSVSRAAVVSGDAALYAGPGDWYEVLTYLSSGTSVSLQGASVDGYFPVSADGYSGYLPTWQVSGDGNVSSGDSYAADTYATDSYASDSYAADSYVAAEADSYVAAADSYTEPAADSYSADSYTADSYTPAHASGGHGNGHRGNSGDGDLVPPPGESTAAGGSSEYSESEILSIIYDAAATYGQSGSAMERVARCESGLNPYAINPRGFYGLFQFHPNTFAGTPYGDRDIFDPVANANAAGWMWQQGRKNEWACQ